MIVRRGDEAIRNDIIRELDWDSRVDGTTMHVAVNDRIVTLTGTARAYLEKVVAQQAAHRVPGVLDVVNDIVVLPSERPDTELAKAVRHALEWNVCVPDQRIASTVSMGCVTLEGTVDRLREREDAEEAVRGLRGVCSVRNEIVVDHRRTDPGLIRAAVDGALARHALHEAKHITVAVNDGIVTLTGLVDSFAEKRAVMGLVSYMPGIRAVRDRLMLPS